MFVFYPGLPHIFSVIYVKPVPSCAALMLNFSMLSEDGHSSVGTVVKLTSRVKPFSCASTAAVVKWVCSVSFPSSLNVYSLVPEPHPPDSGVEQRCGGKTNPGKNLLLLFFYWPGMRKA